MKYYYIYRSDDTFMEDLKKSYFMVSDKQIEYAMRKNGIRDKSIYEYEMYIESSLSFEERVKTLHLFDPESPFHRILHETLHQMLQILPTELVQQTIGELKSSEDNLNTINHFMKTQQHLVYDHYAVTNIYKFIQNSFFDHLENPLKYGILDKKCITGLFVGIRGKPKECSTEKEYKLYVGCLKAIQSSIQAIKKQENEIDYTKKEPVLTDYQIFVSRFQKLLIDIQKSADCQSLERIKDYSLNLGKYSSGDQAFLFRLTSAYPPLGGSYTRKQKRLRRLRRTRVCKRR